MIRYSGVDLYLLKSIYEDHIVFKSFEAVVNSIKNKEKFKVDGKNRDFILEIVDEYINKQHKANTFRFNVDQVEYCDWLLNHFISRYKRVQIDKDHPVILFSDNDLKNRSIINKSYNVYPVPYVTAFPYKKDSKEFESYVSKYNIDKIITDQYITKGTSLFLVCSSYKLNTLAVLNYLMNYNESFKNQVMDMRQYYHTTSFHIVDIMNLYMHPTNRMSDFRSKLVKYKLNGHVNKDRLYINIIDEFNLGERPIIRRRDLDNELRNVL